MPLPKSFLTKLAILSAVLVCESLAATVLFPFVGLFVARLMDISPNEAGYWSGILVAVFQLGQMLTGKMWGNASDKVGRKPMIQLGLIANGITLLFFGMSPNIYFCIAIRFINGCANGNVLVAKTVIADITDVNTEGTGFAAISIFWGLGSVIGPAVGGFLYDPAVNMPQLSTVFTPDSVFASHPALLASLTMAVFSFFTLILITYALPETSRHPVDPFLSLFTDFWKSSTSSSTATDIIIVASAEDWEDEESSGTGGGKYRGVRIESPQQQEQDTRFGNNANSLRQRPPQGKTDDAVHMPNSSEENSTLLMEGDVGVAGTKFGYTEAFQMQSSRCVLIMYMCIASTECALLEIIPLWAIASPHKGGLAFTSTDVGYMLCMSSIVCVVANIFFGSLVACMRDGTRTLWDFSVLFWALTSIVTPCSVFLPRQHQFWFAAIVTSLREIGLSWAYSLNYMYVVRSVPEKFVGAMNGIAQSTASFSRMVTMLLVPPVFAWSLNNEAKRSFPMNFPFSFWVMCIPLLISYLFSSALPPRVTHGAGS